MRLFAQSKIHKLLSSLALITVIVLAVAKSGYVEQAKQIILAPAPIVNTSYVIHGAELGAESEEDIYLALQSYNRNEHALQKVLEHSGVELRLFSDTVHTVFVIDSTNTLLNISVQFSSSIPTSKLERVYEHIVDELKRHILEELSKSAQPAIL